VRPSGVTLRSTCADDEPFLRRLYASTRAEELSVLDGSEEQKQAFLALQFDAQDRHYRARFPLARFDVIERDGVPVGRLCVDRSEGAIHVVDLALLPAHRGGGLGSALLRRLQREAATRGSAVVLHVVRTNPALRLYARLGFHVLHHEAIHVEMVWRAAAGSPADDQP